MNLFKTQNKTVKQFKMKKTILSVFALLTILAACESDDNEIRIDEQIQEEEQEQQQQEEEQPEVADLVTFDITVTNAANFFEAIPFTERLRAGEAPTTGPLTQNGDQYQISFQAVPGTKFTPVTMMGNSNDWFLAPEDFGGIDLWQNGAPVTGDIASELILFDAGTEADNLPEFFPPAGANVGPSDANTATRIVDRGGRRGDTYITAVLDYEAGSPNSAGTFTLTITAIMTPDPSQAPSSENGFVVTPGITVLHALPNPLFTLGDADRGVGLEGIAEDGMPGVLNDWFHQEGPDGDPIRLSSTFSVLSGGVAYAFTQDSDPWFSQGGIANSESGVEEIAEDGNRMVAVAYLNTLEGVTAAANNENANVAPGESLTFELTVPVGAGYKFGYGTMLVNTNDWFIAYNNSGFPLFGEDGQTPYSGFDATSKSYLYDAGTEVDQPVGFGADQAPRQASFNTGAPDSNTTIRRVSNLEDVQFGKGIYSSGPGVVAVSDGRGGYNLVTVEIRPRN